jgi:hypothetical protein
MVHQKFYEPEGQFWGWRCIFCGDIVDSIILENRHVSRISGSGKNGAYKSGDGPKNYMTNTISQVKTNTEPEGYAAGVEPCEDTLSATDSQ